jgi:hypothetical protein
LNITQISPTEFKYNLDGKQEDIKLEKGESLKLMVTSDQLSKLTFEPGSGKAGVTSIYSTPLNAQEVVRDQNLTLLRQYLVNAPSPVYDLNSQAPPGLPNPPPLPPQFTVPSVSVFNQSDLVRIQLDYSLGPKSVDGCYQVTDILPSGLKPVTKTLTQAYGDTRIWYPYEINGQKVSFCVYKNSPQRPITYYARVVSKGEYKADQALIQSQKAFNSLNITESTSVNIK